MASPLTIPQIITIAKISEYLSANYIADGALFGARKIPTNPRIIYMEYKALSWMYDLDPTNESLRLVGNYVYSLCKKNLKAKAISGSGGSISPINPNISIPVPVEFVVTGSSFMIDGQASVLIPQFAGYNVMFNRNNIPQTQVDTGNGTYFTWNKNTTLFTVYGAANLEELFSINAI